MSELAAEALALDPDDRHRLVALHAVLAPDFAAIADEFYAAAMASPATAAILSAPQRVARLHRSLVDWMSTGLRGPYDAAFYAKRSAIGRRHVELGLAQHFMIAAMGVVRRAYRHRIAATYAGDEREAAGNAADKLLDLELAVMLQHYQEDSEERARSAEQHRRIEQVGAMRTLCAGLAHEVRNPVNSAKLQLELAARRLRKGDDVAEPLERVGQEIDRLTILLDEFLTFAQPRALDTRPEDICAIVRGVIEGHRALAAEHRVALALEAPATPIVAEVDATKLRQIVANLVCNAIEATGGGAAVAIHDAEGHVRIRVTDDGPGIPADVLPRIYEPFFTTKDGGTGMGMSIAHSLVAQHDGSIEISSSPSGTVVEVALPRHARVRY